MNEKIPCFGENLPHLPLVKRPGAYALILNSVGCLAVLKLPEGWYLPGGGQEGKEGLESCLEREVQEETGYGIEMLWYLGQAGQYLVGRDRVLFKLGHFFLAEFNTEKQAAGEDQHELHWLSLPDAIAKLKHPYQAWAVEKLSALMGA
ncbi:DNA mismatch repair protein MutT [bacterium (Candidatus Blackallbacteria) CG17_big_fil_post_rev_8_21_14_2_50_48_46]|uniref:DNA mismatch repair protein MutT n=1 Tax=bacterium (Candidatus Blackallbacteria) CG17_big_fil_post_rev_8_21_14_2_50_48_46 TaxID=2014261 RepID=A0A2M7G6E5_9BACT|nr:MAG: DNA mismatch repair protein MutT [bacterium (Candidatus Blackallbacteria) CG18_big_fil_WC_8_21_14_2_50_49_26]PIW17565.1 MAG: DNA mismatch repair protein MutT [bacterium (Candidatus Blackallbacteria) CG17_big_fil_post_rev_8_21_14_2_50_48_46]PIW48420.1 MAG: DNA mismatch repair protein MutT [bacterium (Candidatus Blackallbacteria) CG13_big_fil_rev_8_21_14_2_50_49_14]